MADKHLIKIHKKNKNKNKLIDTSISVGELLIDRQIELIDELTKQTNQLFNCVIALNQYHANNNIEEYNSLKPEVKEQIEQLSSLCSEYYDFVVQNKLDKKYIKHAELYLERNKIIEEIFNSLEDEK